ncbi:YgiW/YdeI family stress tolerance OB fold protein [Vibrio rumoiensis]|uniref:YgiW/YdeI family stress tolerance OB fold protein n=1 Tax=Vibrio rumoiensis TaxID=76258 RepID=A0ABW7J009_9VIBR
MKKTLSTLSLAALISIPSLAMAEVVSPAVKSESSSQGGFQGPRHGTAVIETIKAAKEASDDAKVVLTGKIKSSLGDEDYIFADSTGDITVEIDHDKWHGRTVTTEHTVVLRGEVDKDWNSLTIDVDSLEVQ